MADSSLVAQYHARFPHKFFLDADDPEALETHLRKYHHMQPEEHITGLAKPGEGNMNYVLRVTTNQRTFIIKQARPWVEKYPQIPAPIERAQVEYTFLKTVQSMPEMAIYSPRSLWFDTDHDLLAMEDLGEASDLTDLYQQGKKLVVTVGANLMSFLNSLHQAPAPNDFPENMDMRKLNHEHIFRFPFDPNNGLNLDDIQPGLEALARPYRENTPLQQVIDSLGLIYLSPGHTLIHGDYYPGSWLQSATGVKVIDPEFAFVGIPEFDLGVLYAHLVMTSQPAAVMQQMWSIYTPSPTFDLQLMSGFAGVEIMRRLIGIAQLPLKRSVDEKASLMEQAEAFLLLGALRDILEH